MHTLRLLWAAQNEMVWRRRQARLLQRRCLERIEDMPNQLFINHFRLTKNLFWMVCEELRSKTSLRGSPQIPLEIKVLCCLSFLATGSYQRIVGVTLHLPQRTASRCIRQVVDALNNNRVLQKFIKFPQTRQERQHIQREFQRNFNLPGIIGCIDCTHIAIVKPNEDEHLYFNRKGFHSLNVQMVCDDKLKIINVNSKFGGATHDSHIWAASQVQQYMRQLHENGEHVWLLGDSGYPQRSWLMTPILNAPPGSREEMYTTRHVRARANIERCFGVLKSRWRCLFKHRTLHYHPTVASKITLACCVLHNIAVEGRLPSEIIVNEDDNNDEGSLQISNTTGSQTEQIEGTAMLNYLISTI